MIDHQFESIHPFSDGNGRIGRIVNVLYLTWVGLLETPILYLSRYITAHKADYNLFRHPYTRIEFMQEDLNVTRQTAARYLEKFAEAGFVERRQQGRNKYYINTPLIELFIRVAEGR